MLEKGLKVWEFDILEVYLPDELRKHLQPYPKDITKSIRSLVVDTDTQHDWDSLGLMKDESTRTNKTQQESSVDVRTSRKAALKMHHWKGFQRTESSREC
jgi:hypothetical protein